MGRIVTLALGGGLRAVESFAAEAAGIVPPVSRGTGRSLQSLAIAAIRRQFPLQTAGQAGYEIARNVWRRSLRMANALVRDRERVASGQPPRGPRGPRTGGGGAAPRNGVYVYRVEFVSDSGVSRWRTLTARGPAGMPDDALLTRADIALANDIGTSRRQRYDRGYIAQSASAQSVVVIAFYPDE